VCDPIDDPDFYAAVARESNMKIRYVIVGSEMVRPRDYTLAKGFFWLRWTKGFRQVFHNNGAIVYEIDGQQNVAGTVTSGAAGR